MWVDSSYRRLRSCFPPAWGVRRSGPGAEDQRRGPRQPVSGAPPAPDRIRPGAGADRGSSAAGPPADPDPVSCAPPRWPPTGEPAPCGTRTRSRRPPVAPEHATTDVIALVAHLVNEKQVIDAAQPPWSREVRSSRTSCPQDLVEVALRVRRAGPGGVGVRGCPLLRRARPPAARREGPPVRCVAVAEPALSP